MRTAEPRIRYLDCWRAIAVSLVIISHLAANVRLADALASHGIKGVFAYGRLGVLLFFFISGFVVTKASLAQARLGAFTAAGFYIKRAFRIVPPFALYLVALLGLGAAGVMDFTGRHFLSAFFYACNSRIPGADCGLLAAHAWSLSFEEQFYLLFAWVFVAMHGSRRPRLGLLVLVLPVVLLPLLLPLDWVGVSGFFEVYSLFGLGYLCARHEERVVAFVQPRALALFVLGLVVCFARPELLRAIGVHMTIAQYYPAYVVGAPLVVLSSGLLAGRSGALFNLRPVAYVGRISYSIYLWQQLFTLSPQFIGAAPLVQIGSLAGMALGCALLYEVVEKRLIRVGRRLAERRPQADPAGGAAPA